ncbi:aldehyde dehydrogenase [Leucobacter sp. CSA1]|uniref:Aldehyde dehydrogenase n=1 Tax=Leucobacter chromiisoli TaxID=2796471 RepID=A0A934UTQ4_9MICO|nr:aldehyde dehydrogenase family protein [Leucobacter chromiisoli]MBK0418654.1 aldehyde dehydrogenase [Leucobacter chromiisoli]
MTQHRLLIGGEWVDPAGGESFAAYNPATGERLADVALGTVEDVDRAVRAARGAAAELAATSVEQRAEWCEAVAAAIVEHADELARALSEDQGKPLEAEARGEILTAAKGFRDAAGHVRHLDGVVPHAENPNKKVLSVRRPRGVYAVITPWNFPVNIPTEYLAPALATGNAVVWVPAPSTSHVAVRFAEVLAASGIPAGALNLVTGPGDVVGDALVGHPDIDGVGFTGSTATGMSIARRAAGKPLLLELGGNGPTIVLDDADLPAAAKAIAAGAYFNGGQVCAATEVVLVERGVHDELAALVLEETRSIVSGDPADPGTTMGPLNNEATAAKMDAHILDAEGRGASVAAGGRRDDPSSLYYAPTVLTGVPAEADVVRYESFGPIVPLVPVDSAEEAVEIAQAPQFGLCSAVWSRSAARAFAVAERLRTGIVNINDASTYWEIHMPFGGGSGTMSGLGRLGGMHTLLEMTEIKTITFDVTTF